MRPTSPCRPGTGLNTHPIDGREEPPDRYRVADDDEQRRPNG